MKFPTGLRAPSLGIALVLIVNAVVLAGVWYNRGGTPDATIVLTERELPLAWGGAWGGARVGAWSSEDTGIALRINWRPSSDEWLDRKAIQRLGFDVARMDAWAKAKTRLYAKQLLSQRAFVVLEYDGPAWAEYLHMREKDLAELKAKVRKGKAHQKALDEARDDLNRVRRGGSRLFGVEVGRDAAALRRKYPNRARYLIVPAVVRAYYTWSAKDNHSEIGGVVTTLLPPTLHVSAAQARRLPSDDTRVRYERYFWHGVRAIATSPRYEVTVHYGRRHEGWIADIRPLTHSNVSSPDRQKAKPTAH